ncbi:DnaJ domain-containing protein [Pseudonocardia ammonioxydans]|nr:DnaJ domain-containing protein [Pseudonocardia ammonioxydans]
MADCERDFYADLGVGTDASTELVRRAYRAQARRLHPDLNPAPDASVRFARVAAAYAVLADPARRAAYDQARTDATAASEATAPAAGTTPAGRSPVYDDYAPAGTPVAFEDYAPIPGYAPGPPPQPVPPRWPPGPTAPAPRPTGPAPSWAASRYVPPTRAPFPSGWPASRIDHRRLGGRLLLKVWRLAPLPANRVGLVLTVLATVGVAYIAGASRAAMPLEAGVIGALAGLALACWGVRGLVWTVLLTRARRAVKETR